MTRNRKVYSFTIHRADPTDSTDARHARVPRFSRSLRVALYHVWHLMRFFRLAAGLTVADGPRRLYYDFGAHEWRRLAPPWGERFVGLYYDFGAHEWRRLAPPWGERFVGSSHREPPLFDPSNAPFLVDDWLAAHDRPQRLAEVLAVAKELQP